MADPKPPEAAAAPIPLRSGAEAPTFAPLAGLAGRSRGRERIKAILSQKDPGRLVRELPITDFFYLVKEVGVADAQEMLELCDPEQFQGLCDLDAWHGDHLDTADLRPYLASLIQAGPERLTEIWSQLDPELTALILQRWTRIYNLAEEELPEDEEPPFYETPDRFFMVKITAENDEDVQLVALVLDHLYRVDAVQARHTLRAAQSEPTAELEESSRRWARNRLAELGFPDPAEARAVYQPLDPSAVTVDEKTRVDPPHPQRLPAPIVGPALGAGFLGQVLARVTDGALADRVESDLALLFNEVLAADAVAPGDIPSVVAGTARAAATISLGLETAARGDVDRALVALAGVSLRRLHRVGHGVALSLGRLLDTLGARAGRVGEPLATMVAPLRGPRPAFSRLLDEPPQPGTRPIASAADVRRATWAVTRVAAQVVLVHDVIGRDPAALGQGVTLGDVGRTACAAAALGRPPDGARLRLPDVVELGRHMAGGQVPPELRERIHGAVLERAAARGIAPPPECAEVLDGWIADLALGVEKRGQAVVLDRSFVEGLLLEG